jgi:hypothetical protein
MSILSIYLPTYLASYLSIYPAIYLSSYLSIYLPMYLCIYVSMLVDFYSTNIFDFNVCQKKYSVIDRTYLDVHKFWSWTRTQCTLHVLPKKSLFWRGVTSQNHPVFFGRPWVIFRVTITTKQPHCSCGDQCPGCSGWQHELSAEPGSCDSQQLQIFWQRSQAL